MMAEIRNSADKKTYSVADAQCIGRECLNLHPVGLRAPTPSGSRLIGYVNCCARREYHGCPTPVPEFNRQLAGRRQRLGLKNVPHQS